MTHARPHIHEPEPGTYRRERDSESADLMDMYDYPILATCEGCGHTLRAASYYAPFRDEQPATIIRLAG